MVALRQFLLVVHYCDHSWIWRHSTSQTRSRVLAILIAFLGLILTGIVIAVAVRAGSLALDTPGS